jgi:uncharacterized protein YjbI with pentapeptide repeats
VPPPDSRIQIDAPDLPALERMHPSRLAGSGALQLDGVLLEFDAAEAIRAERIEVLESRLSGVVLAPTNAPGLKLRDVVLRDCDLSNVDGREGSLTRVEVHNSRLIGFSLTGGAVQDLRVLDSAFMLASFAFARLRNVTFERVTLSEASFMEAQLQRVEFVDCELAGSDFRGATFKDCAIRGTSLEGILGVESMKGLAMPWPDILGSAATLAAVVGITIEPD